MIGIYGRVSTEEQAQHGTSVDNQKDRGIAFCISQGWDDYALYIDDGYTGTNLNRPALKRLLRHIDEGKIKVVIVYKLDRLGRKQLDVLSLLETFEEKGVAFKSVTEPFDTSTPLGKAMIGILAVFAQLERDMIVERTTEGRRKRTSQGLWYGGRVPFGYSWNEVAQRLEIIPEEARIIKEIYNRYLQGHSRLSISEWAAGRSTARVFDHNIVRDILSRVVYMGKLMNGDEMVDGKHEAIIDMDTWFRVQKEKETRKEGRAPIGDYLLTGLLECGVCGSGIVHVRRHSTNKNTGKKYVYELYACRNQHVRHKDKKEVYCHLGYRQRVHVEDEVIDEIKSVALNPKKLEMMSEQYTNQDNVDDKVLEEELMSQLNKVNKGLENLYDAIQNGTIKASAVGSRIRTLEEEREAIEEQLDDLKDDIDDHSIDTSMIIHLAKEIGEAWEYLEIEEQKMLVRKMIRKITLLPKKKLEIHWNVQ